MSQVTNGAWRPQAPPAHPYQAFCLVDVETGALLERCPQHDIWVRLPMCSCLLTTVHVHVSAGLHVTPSCDRDFGNARDTKGISPFHSVPFQRDVLACAMLARVSRSPHWPGPISAICAVRCSSIWVARKRVHGTAHGSITAISHPNTPRHAWHHHTSERSTNAVHTNAPSSTN
jgi:hypothetical protein